MLKQITKEEVPRYRKPKSEARQFAYDALNEFFSSATIGDICEITELPLTNDDPAKNAERVASAFRDELFYMRKRDQAKIFRRKDRLFIERVKPIRVQKTERNPYKWN